MTAATEPHWRRLQHPAFCRITSKHTTIVLNGRYWTDDGAARRELVEAAVDEFVRAWREQYGVEIA